MEKLTILSPILEQNLETLRNWRNDPSINQFFRNTDHITPQQQQNWFIDYCVNNRTYFEIHEKSSNILIGFCSLTNLDFINKSAEFSIYIGDSQYIGTGHAKDALQNLLTYGFYTLLLNRIWGEVFATNKKALKSFQKAGFVQEGVLRQKIVKNNNFIDTHILSVLLKDFLNAIREENHS